MSANRQPDGAAQNIGANGGDVEDDRRSENLPAGPDEQGDCEDDLEPANDSKADGFLGGT